MSTDSNEANLLAINKAITAIFSDQSTAMVVHLPIISSPPPTAFGATIPLLDGIPPFRDFRATVDGIVEYGKGASARAKKFAALGNLGEAHLHSAEDLSLLF